MRAISKVSPSNLTQEQWEVLGPLILEAKPGGRLREVYIGELLNAIVYILCEGCRWRSLPGGFPKWQTVYTCFPNWGKDGTWVGIHDHLHGMGQNG